METGLQKCCDGEINVRSSLSIIAMTFQKQSYIGFPGVFITKCQGWLKPQKKKILTVLEAGSPQIKTSTGAVSSEAFLIGL